MSKIRRTNTGGSIVLFIVIGAILAICLISSMYILKLRGDQARRDQAISIVEKQFADDQAKKAEVAAAVASTETKSTTNEASSSFNNFTVNEDLPVTGNGIVISELIGAGLITVFAVSYIKSRNYIVRYL